MYINIGGGNVVNEHDIIGIFDLDITSQSKITHNFLIKSEKEGKIVNASEDIPKTFIVSGTKNKNIIYFCQPAGSTLYKRAETDQIGG